MECLDACERRRVERTDPNPCRRAIRHRCESVEAGENWCRTMAGIQRFRFDLLTSK